MFLRRYQRRSGGRRRTYWALVESVRTGRGSRQRVVAYLGELARSEQTGWAQLGRNLSGKQRPSPSLFDPPHYDEPADDEPVLVDLRGVRLERLRDFGDVWMALGLWRLLGLDALLQMVGFFLGWTGGAGRGRALGLSELKFSGQVLPNVRKIVYNVDIKRVMRSKLVLGIADGWLSMDGDIIYRAKDLKVGLFKQNAPSQPGT